RPPPRSTLFPYTTLVRSPGSKSIASRVISLSGIPVTGCVTNGRELMPVRCCAEAKDRDSATAQAGNSRYLIASFTVELLWEGQRSEEHTSELQSLAYLAC